MSFDALTIGGLVAVFVSGGFLVVVVRNNDRRVGRETVGASMRDTVICAGRG